MSTSSLTLLMSFSLLLLSACGGSSSSTQSTNLVGIQGNGEQESIGSSGNNPVENDDPNTGTGVETEIDVGSRNSVEVLMGSWQGACASFEFAGISVREILAFSATTLARDWYEYDGPDCKGVPRGKSFPVRLHNYALSDSLISTDGIVRSGMVLGT